MLGEEPARDGNAGLVRRLFDAFAARDVDALLEIVDPEIEFFGPTATVLNEGRCYRGHEGMRRYLRDAEALWEELDLDPQKLRVIGNHVVVLGRVRARARDSFEIDAAAAWVWRVEHERVTWGCAYGDPDQMPRSLQEGGRGPAFEAARLRAPSSPARAKEPLR
jgi:ketosteroid isomerase-like protein